VLRAAARRVASGGRLVVTTPNVATARHRFELLLRGRLTAFRPDNLTHVTPALPHVLARVLEEEGLGCTLEYAARDVIPFTGGRRWPRAISTLAPRLTRVSCVVSAQRLPTETRLGDGYEETTASESAAYLVRSCPPADQPT
jgi:hypothetical protein